MKVAAFLATLFIRLVGIYLLFSSASALLALTSAGVGGAINDRLAIVLTLQIGVGAVALLLAGRLVRLFTVDAPLGNE